MVSRSLCRQPFVHVGVDLSRYVTFCVVVGSFMFVVSACVFRFRLLLSGSALSLVVDCVFLFVSIFVLFRPPYPCLSLYHSLYLPLSLSLCLSVSLSFSRSLFLSISLYLSIYLSILLSIHIICICRAACFFFSASDWST